MNDNKYSNNLEADPSSFVSLDKINSMFRLPSNLDLDSKFISVNEAVQEERAGLSNEERSIKTFVYDSHDYYSPIIGSAFSSVRAAARGIAEIVGSASEAGVRRALDDTSRLYLSRFKITSKS